MVGYGQLCGLMVVIMVVIVLFSLEFSPGVIKRGLIVEIAVMPRK